MGGNPCVQIVFIRKEQKWKWVLVSQGLDIFSQMINALMVTMGIKKKKKKTKLSKKKKGKRKMRKWEKKENEKRRRREYKEELREWWVKIKEKRERETDVFMGNVHSHCLY